MKGKQALQNIHNQSKNKKERLSNLAFKVNKTKKWMKSCFCPNLCTPQKDYVCVLQQAYASRLQARFPEKYQKMKPNLSKNVYVQT